MKRVRELSCIAVDDRAVVFGVVFSCRLVFCKVPTGGEFGFQSLLTKKTNKKTFDFRLAVGVCFSPRKKSSFKSTATDGVNKDTDPDFPQEIADDIKSRDPGGGREGRAAAAVGQCCTRAQANVSTLILFRPAVKS